VMELLVALHQAGSTIVMVTHDPRFTRYADRTVHLFDGRIVEETHARDAEAKLTESGFALAEAR
jgi:putative ABC transport system ATP-binding protein